MDINRLTLFGRLGGDPDIRTLDNDELMVSFSVATSERWTDKRTGETVDRTEWHRAVARGPLARVAADHLRKGARVLLEGPVRARKYTDSSGTARTITEVVLSGPAARLHVIDWPNDGQRAAATTPAKRASTAGRGRSGDGAGFDDEIPF